MLLLSSVEDQKKMSRSTGGSEAVVPATIERIGMLKLITPAEGSVSNTMVKMPGERSQAYEWTSKINREDKLSGSYERYTAKEKASRGEPHVEKGTGRVGVKDEFKKSTTVKFGNKNGYREYHIEERLRDVNFGKSNNGEQGPNKYTTRDESDSDESDSDESDSDNNEEQGLDKCSTPDESDSDSDTEGGYSYESDSDSDTDGGYSYSYNDSDDDYY
ncbi:hypothetical protein RHMOL_Rhmol03G0289900 [Rhododendron molle]|uniref:Uncharacterized protein n=1 Tax=Rhododendron molle TaxID=49168 RepID=A0ACC0PKX8_RHOML|nr:hypothetical protein RHMOL_Rhmol03G0289900 [Rhododendron molle]